MSEQPKPGKKAAERMGANASVDALASRALSVVASRSSKPGLPMSVARLQKLHDAAANGRTNTVPDVVKEMLEDGISAEVIAVNYIPEVARQMGEEWCEDELSFGHVTIGTARLQSALRVLGKDWWLDGRNGDGANDKGVVVVVAQDAYHTLGASILCGQLRQFGLSVRLAMGTSPEDLKRSLHGSTFDAILLSASSAESLDFLREYVETIRATVSGQPPIVVGGGILDQEADVKTAIGVDFATKDPFEALEFCGLTKNNRNRTSKTGQRG
ncbi:cobalamin B12-binding domain-containing protein [Pseudooctadecabacter jejudonensis]|uniref:B12 binding domain protein n=1 Tax=Pseudooctadecabacter jejudonensis TaxID=1391910 RepID=A0A1Y5S4Z1_9RHOB|nr:cobalamin B12-binding domain-containing protein [Pseudooctadecabacter jejudonensis]SLN32438.1 B12 binding domain protein [Pseudooctadecabacter jejudonensis]